MRPRFKDWIIHEDEQLIAINKPAGIASLDEREMNAPSVLRMALQYDKKAQLCHRIDKDTSGLLLISRDPEVYKTIAGLFRERKIKKNYLAIAEGRHYFDHVLVDIPVATTTRGRARTDLRQGKPAQTYFDTLEVFNHFTLVNCQPITGRLHQIRVHLLSQNATIAADVAYGGQLPYLSSIKRHFNIGRGKEESPMIRRHALHAWKLEFELKGVTYLLQADEPNDMAVFIKQLRKFDSSEVA